jgi:hypothetical protein
MNPRPWAVIPAPHGTPPMGKYYSRPAEQPSQLLNALAAPQGDETLPREASLP